MQLAPVLVIAALALAGCAGDDAPRASTAECPPGTTPVDSGVPGTPLCERPSTAISLSLMGGRSDEGVAPFTVASVTTGVVWERLAFTLDAAPLAIASSCAPATGEVARCVGSTAEQATDTVSPGDSVLVGAESGQILRVHNVAENNVVLQVRVG